MRTSKFFQLYILVLALLFTRANLNAQQVAATFVEQTGYLLYLPEQYRADTTKRWPLVMFLHGSGESGQDIEKVKKHGPPKMAANGKSFPFILVSPQAPIARGGWDTDKLYRLIQEIKKNYRVDASRVYLTGLSMGGFGTFSLAMKYPQEFAAIAPVCGGGDTTNAWKLRNMAVWCFHGADDDVVPSSASIHMVNAAKRYNPNIKFTLYENTNHNSWDTTYNKPAFYDWLLAQKKARYREIKPAPGVLEKYTGTYIGEDGDTIDIKLQEGQLIANPERDPVPLKPAGDDLFFIRADQEIDIRFNLENGAVVNFLFMGERKILYRKI